MQMRSYYEVWFSVVVLVAGCARSPDPQPEKPTPVAAAAPVVAIAKPDPTLSKFASRLLAFHEEIVSALKLVTKDISLDAWQRKVESIDDIESRIPTPPPEYKEVCDQCMETWKHFRRNISRAYETRAQMRANDNYADMDKATTIGKTRKAALAGLEIISANPQFAELQRLSGDTP
jgi:hypothetical protein